MRACQELGIKVRATIRQCTDEEADQIHELENRARKSKSVYSQGLRYSQLLQSGRYESQDAMGIVLGVDQAQISRSVRLVTDAPQGMWEKVSDPSSLTWRDAAILLDAYKHPAFARATKEKERLTAGQLLGLARKALRVKPPAQGQWRVVRGSQGYVLKHPAIKDKAIAEKALAAMKRILEEHAI